MLWQQLYSLLSNLFLLLIASIRRAWTDDWRSTTGDPAPPDCPAASLLFSKADARGLQQQKLLFEQEYAALGYGYGGSLAQLRRDHFPQLGTVTYLDHAAATLYSVQQLSGATQELCQQLFSNPHSQLGAGVERSAAAEQELRLATLAMLQAPPDEYEVVLTTGATAALKLAAEAFPWTGSSSSRHQRVGSSSSDAGSSSSICAYTTINHNSALGIRQVALAAGATAVPVDITQLKQLQQQQQVGQQKVQQQQQEEEQQGTEQELPVLMHHLFVAPSECNFSGTRYSPQQLLQIFEKQQQQQQASSTWERQRWWLLVDAAKSCGSHPPDCSDCSIDLLALSYYKIFGHPTGLGALLVRRQLLPLLLQHKAYFGGGTVQVSLPDQPCVVRRKGRAGLEDGTLPFTSIAAARYGFRQLQLLGSFSTIGRHMTCLTWHVMSWLLQLRHSNGRRVAALYCEPEVQQLLQQQQGDASAASGKNSTGTAAAVAAAAPSEEVFRRFEVLQGPVVAFNLVRPDGSWVGPGEVSRLAVIHGIAVRTGCFCNPGACCRYLQLSSQDLLANHAAGHVCWDDNDVVNGRPTGAVRASFGYMSSFDDVAALTAFVQKFFVNNSGVVGTAAATGSSGPAAGSAAATAAGGDRIRRAELAANGISLSSATNGRLNGSCNGVGKHQQHEVYINSSSDGTTPSSSSSNSGRLSALYLYPIKSCGAQQVAAWPLGPNGLLYDREWALCAPDGRVLVQKQNPGLTQLRPEVDLSARVLRVSAPGMQQQLVVPLQGLGSKVVGSNRQPAAAAAAAVVSERPVGPEVPQGFQTQQQQQQQQDDDDDDGVAAVSRAAAAAAGRLQQEIRVCGDTVCSQLVTGQVVAGGAAADAAAVQRWFTAALGQPCKLVQQVSNSRTVRQQQQQQTNGSSTSSLMQDESRAAAAAAAAAGAQTLGFANEGQYLLVNQASVDEVAAALSSSSAVSSSSSSDSGISGAAASAGAPDALRFRPNLVVSGFRAWAEDDWRFLLVGGAAQAASSAAATSAEEAGVVPSSASGSGMLSGAVRLAVVGACGRCDMIRIDQSTGQRYGSELLALLARSRRQKGKLNFGVLLANCQVPEAEQQQQQRQELSQQQAPHCSWDSSSVVWLRVGDAVLGVS